MYLGTETAGASPPSPEGDPDPAGTPLCNACLQRRLEIDLSAFTGRCLLFEPALGPDTFAWRPIGSGSDPQGFWTPSQEAAARSTLDGMDSGCDACGESARFLWIPVEPDANLWAGDWLEALAAGELAPSGSLCGRCASARLAEAIDSRGLCFEAFAAPPGGDPGARGAMFCAEVEGPETDDR